jgi:hypothetical protein
MIAKHQRVTHLHLLFHTRHIRSCQALSQNDPCSPFWFTVYVLSLSLHYTRLTLWRIQSISALSKKLTNRYVRLEYLVDFPIYSLPHPSPLYAANSSSTLVPIVTQHTPGDEPKTAQEFGVSLAFPTWPQSRMSSYNHSTLAVPQYRIVHCLTKTAAVPSGSLLYECCREEGERW